MLNKPSSAEDEYFAREDVEKKRKLAFQQAQLLSERQQEALKTLHFMKCPKCGFDLQPLKSDDLSIDTCFNCKGVWLDAGEMEQLKQRYPTVKRPVFEAILNLFKGD
jgi:hypothetical protein